MYAYKIEGTSSLEYILLDKKLRDYAEVRSEGRIQCKYAATAPEKFGVRSAKTAVARP